MSATDIVRCREGAAEVSRGHSRSLDPTEGPNMKSRERTRISMSERDAYKRAEMLKRVAGGGGRKSPVPVTSASSTPARRVTPSPKAANLMEAVVERESLGLVSLRAEVRCLGVTS